MWQNLSVGQTILKLIYNKSEDFSQVVLSSPIPTVGPPFINPTVGFYCVLFGKSIESLEYDTVKEYSTFIKVVSIKCE